MLIQQPYVGFGRGTKPLPIYLDDAFERSSANVGLSTITLGGGLSGSDLISIWPRATPSEFHSGGVRWLEPSIELVNVLGLQPTLRMLNLYTGSNGGTEWDWDTNRRPMYSEDGGFTWAYFPSISISGSGTARYAQFRLDRPFASSRVRIGRSRQVSVHHCGEWLAALAALYPSVVVPGDSAAAYTPSGLMSGFSAQTFIADEFLTQMDELGRTIPKMPFYAARVNDTTRTPTILGPSKRVFMVTGGVHAGEDLSDWFLQGFFKKLLAGSSAGNLLLSECEFLLFPLINGPGRAGGEYRGGFTVNAGKDDANRNFSSTGVLDIVDRPKAAMVTDLAARVPLVSVDFHGTGNYRYGFVQDPDVNEPLHTEFNSRIEAKTARVWNDEADTLTGHLAGWSRGLGTQLHLTIEHGDVTPILEAERDGICEDYVEVFAEMITAGLFV